MSDSPGEQPILTGEAELALGLGVEREVLSQVRASALVEGEDWKRGERGAIVYLPAGVEKALALLSAPEREKDAAQGAASATVGASALIVARPSRMNRRLLFAREKGAGAEGAEVPVRVQDARLFRPGQEILATCEGGFWRLYGRQPRARGRLQVPPRGQR